MSGRGRSPWSSTRPQHGLLAAFAIALFAVGLAAGGLLRPSRSSGAGADATHPTAWMAVPDPAPTAVTAPAPTTTVTSPPPPTPAGDRPPAPPRRAAAPPVADPPSTQARISAALGRISYPWQQLGYRIVFLGPQPGISGRTSPLSLATIEIYVRPDETVDMLAHVIAHEIGHAVDLRYGNDQRRSLWLELRGAGPQPWFTCSMCQDFSTPAGDFAETFAFWQLHDFSRSMVAPLPTAAQLSQLARLFAP